MSKTVFCQYLKKEAPAMPMQMYPGELGKRIYENISLEAWQQWIRKQTMLINEHKYVLTNPEHRKLIEEAMVGFLFEGKDVKIEGYVAPEVKVKEA